MSKLTLTDRGQRDTCLGRVTQIKIFSPDYRPLSWREVWETFARKYPGMWAVQIFPPADQLIDQKSVYHLFVCESEPLGLNLR